MARFTRVRLVAMYVAFVAILLTATGLFFRQHLRSEAVLNARLELEADWGATLGFLHIDNQRPEWLFDRNDPEQSFTVQRLRDVFQLTGPDGGVLEQSSIFRAIKTTAQTSPQPFYNPGYSMERDQNGSPYIVWTGWIRDDQNHRYPLAIGRSLEAPYHRADMFLFYYALVCLMLIALSTVFSWWLTGAAMRKNAN